VAETGVMDEVAGTFNEMLGNMSEFADEVGLLAQLESVMSVYNTLSENLHWNWADEVFGTCVDTEQLFGRDIDSELDRI
jgi:hypothetical protein